RDPVSTVDVRLRAFAATVVTAPKSAQRNVASRDGSRACPPSHPAPHDTTATVASGVRSRGDVRAGGGDGLRRRYLGAGSQRPRHPRHRSKPRVQPETARPTGTRTVAHDAGTTGFGGQRVGVAG